MTQAVRFNFFCGKAVYVLLTFASLKFVTSNIDNKEHQLLQFKLIHMYFQTFLIPHWNELLKTMHFNIRITTNYLLTSVISAVKCNSAKPVTCSRYLPLLNTINRKWVPSDLYFSKTTSEQAMHCLNFAQVGKTVWYECRKPLIECGTGPKGPCTSGTSDPSSPFKL